MTELQEEEENLLRLRQSAIEGHVDAQFKLAWIFDRGLGVEPNPEEALKWYGEAAKGGHEEAHCYIWQLYENARSGEEF
eukprot:CAMPEP_0201490056 /NCGR_PEP_ID=MMETSP0151_2-20130828/24865_1 /ASSEMBLY_ACC=CAM_ASM_000257 /TAXON_ID=200890 /ORGANISM="Paramoeba atlantica, Strain 621/1 / CCAP 1560/9" /LENGTH=78 /DNA_ID=CAMNT_0047875853 /DNA_START=54 /DNA_END=290 /DNA_ORIENTATION=+